MIFYNYFEPVYDGDIDLDDERCDAILQTFQNLGTEKTKNHAVVEGIEIIIDKVNVTAINAVALKKVNRRIKRIIWMMQTLITAICLCFLISY